MKALRYALVGGFLAYVGVAIAGAWMIEKRAPRPEDFMIDGPEDLAVFGPAAALGAVGAGLAHLAIG